MKKLLLILLLIIYSSSSIGVIIKFHYCCGKLKDIDFASAKGFGCKNEIVSHYNSKECCEESEIEIKLTDDQYLSKVDVRYFPVQVPPVSHDYRIQPFFVNTIPLQPSNYHRLNKPPQLFLLHCDFRI